MIKRPIALAPISNAKVKLRGALTYTASILPKGARGAHCVQCSYSMLVSRYQQDDGQSGLRVHSQRTGSTEDALVDVHLTEPPVEIT